MSTRTAPKRPKYDACIKALQPAGPSESALAPASMRACTTAVCPIWAARIRGVNPCLSFIFTSAPPQSWLEPPRDRHQRMTKQEEFCRTYPEHSDRLRPAPARGGKQYRLVWPRAPTAYLQTRLARSHLFVLGTDLRRHLL